MTVSKSRRERVFARDGLVCHYCRKTCTRARGGLAPIGLNATVDHVKPVARGGSDSVRNLVCACADCNTAKGDGDWPVWQDTGRSLWVATRTSDDARQLARAIVAQDLAETTGALAKPLAP